MDKLMEQKQRKIGDLNISHSSIARLEREVKVDKNKHDTLRIKILTMHGAEKDLAKEKNDKTLLEKLKADIRRKEAAIIDIKLSLK